LDPSSPTASEEEQTEEKTSRYLKKELLIVFRVVIKF